MKVDVDITSLPAFAILPFNNSPCYPPASTTTITKHNRIVKQTSSWSHCGPLIPIPSSSSQNLNTLPASFHEWSSLALHISILPRLIPLLTYVNAFLSSNGICHYWITLRATPANHDFEVPRWHVDDYVFPPVEKGSGVAGAAVQQKQKQSVSPRKKAKTVSYGSSMRSWTLSSSKTLISSTGIKPTCPTTTISTSPRSNRPTTWKIISTLHGPSTLFLPLPIQPHGLRIHSQTKKHHVKEHNCTSIRCQGCSSTADEVRHALFENFKNYQSIQAREGECVFFRIGDVDGAVHSEPDMRDGDRIFVNIVPGTEDELKRLMGRFGMEFPRSWWVGDGTR